VPKQTFIPCARVVLPKIPAELRCISPASSTFGLKGFLPGFQIPFAVVSFFILLFLSFEICKQQGDENLLLLFFKAIKAV
jgi:hypothetical protein